MKITREELAKICDAKDTICQACGCIEYCDECHVTHVVNEAFNNCDEYSEGEDENP